ncbi:hypothetical protein ACFV1W_33475 [Kitasatospora sp. NPDC059648]|uniref:hypothetical protein n=1 Tax=Kitasatospora sp. NPDC059648 TaxID=3346894 RepID=UPI003685D5DA
MLVHPERAVRRAFARNRHSAPAQRGRLVGDPESLVRANLAAGPRPRLGTAEPLPDHVLETLLTSHNHDWSKQRLTADEIKQELVSSGHVPQSFRRGMLQHPNPELRARATHLWLWLTPTRSARSPADPERQRHGLHCDIHSQVLVPGLPPAGPNPPAPSSLISR